MRFNPDASVWIAKQRILCSLNQSLKDVLNYGLFQPPSDGRDGKFLDEERLLRDYPQPISKGVPALEVGSGKTPPGGQLWCCALRSDVRFCSPQFRYKSRVYKQPHVEEKQISKLHTKVRANVHKQTCTMRRDLVQAAVPQLILHQCVCQG